MSGDAPDRVDPAALVRGLVYTHNRANANTAEVHRANATVQALVELLTERGLLDGDELDQRRQDAAESLQRDYVERGMAVAVQDFAVSKYRFPGGPEIDCDRRIPLCGAACCKLPLALSSEDVREGVVRWDPGRPYLIARGPDHHCAHLDRESFRCGIYQQRPIPCRGYDCRNDSRIWLDFERRIVNPEINDPDWPASLERDHDEAAGDG